MGLTNNNDIYGIPSNTGSLIKDSQETWSDFRFQFESPDDLGRQRSSSFINMLPKSYSLDAIMQEFRSNGLDSPYDPEEEMRNGHKEALIGASPSNHVEYMRQRSWPAPEVTPSLPLPRIGGDMLADTVQRAPQGTLSEESARVLAALLRALEGRREGEVECRFCKSNGERAAFYRSHRLRSRGVVACPVLRAYRCPRCGASGDSAHTLKYCPLASAHDRLATAAVTRGARLASGRCRSPPLPPAWRALERKLASSIDQSGVLQFV